MADYFYAHGKVHPIRSSPGYEDAFVGLRKADKDVLRHGQRGYTYTEPRSERAQRVQALAQRRAAGVLPDKRLAPYMADYAFQSKYKSRLY